MWFFRRKTKKRLESEKALREARENLREVQERSEEVTEVANALKDIREHDDFADMLANIIAPPPEGRA